MGLESARQDPLGRIDPSMVVPRSDPSLNSTPATMAMIEAFRSGQITANEIADRATQHPAMVAAVQRATDPQLVEARKASELAKASSMQSEAGSAAIALKQQQELANIPQFVRGQYLELVKANMAPTIDLKKWDDTATTKVVDAFGKLMDFHREVLKAKTLDDSTEKGEVADAAGTRMVSVSKATQKPVNEDARQAVENWNLKYPNDPQAWIRDGMPRVQSDLFSAPGTVTAPYVPGTLPQDEPRAPMIDGAGAATSGRLVKGPPGLDRPKTEVQTRALTFVVSAREANDNLKTLSKDFNPTSYGNAAQNLASTLTFGLTEGMKSEDLKRYNSAAFAWTEPFLRMNSGAAVPETEVKRYARGYFPQLKDPPSVIQQKAALRARMEATGAAIARGDTVDIDALVSESKAQAGALADLHGVIEKSGTASSLPVVMIKGRRARLDNSDPKHPRYSFEDSANAASEPYVAPETLRKAGGGVKVERK